MSRPLRQLSTLSVLGKLGLAIGVFLAAAVGGTAGVLSTYPRAAQAEQEVRAEPTESQRAHRDNKKAETEAAQPLGYSSYSGGTSGSGTRRTRKTRDERREDEQREEDAQDTRAAAADEVDAEDVEADDLDDKAEAGPVDDEPAPPDTDDGTTPDDGTTDGDTGTDTGTDDGSGGTDTGDDTDTGGDTGGDDTAEPPPPDDGDDGDAEQDNLDAPDTARSNGRGRLPTP